jgi:hypothetical protein
MRRLLELLLVNQNLEIRAHMLWQFNKPLCATDSPCAVVRLVCLIVALLLLFAHSNAL